MDESMLSDTQAASGEGITPLATLELPGPSRLLSNSCCPDKDLAVVIVQSDGKEKLSLWKLQGSKKWEVDVAAEGVLEHRIVAIAWSPDTQSIAVAHHPTRVTLHSIQDGREERVLNLKTPPDNLSLTSLWWFEHAKSKVADVVPDIFKRQGIITGSAHSVLRMLPLLDPIQDISQPLTAAELFAFQHNRVTDQTKPTVPEVILTWPSLPSDPLFASIQPSAREGTQDARPGEELDIADATNLDSLLIVCDASGSIHAFLDGSYSLGAVTLSGQVASSLYKPAGSHQLFVNTVETGINKSAIIHPMFLHYPELERPVARQLAQLSSSARELVWYMKQLLRDLRSIWFGRDNKPGARDMGPKWLMALDDKIRRHGDHGPLVAMLQMTALLLTGKRSAALEDMLANGENTSERSLTKWETTVRDAIVKIRDDCERRLSPACQRLYLILEDLYGFSLTTQYQVFGLDPSSVSACLDLAGRAVVMSSWMAAQARNERSRFTHFIAWLRYEVARTHTGDPPPPPPPLRHDMLKVNEYLMSGLEKSNLDRFFVGPIPQFTLQDLGVPGSNLDLAATLASARVAAEAPETLLEPVKTRDFSGMACNLDGLLDEIASACRAVFTPAAEAVSRSAVVITPLATPLPVSAQVAVVGRERSIAAEIGFTQHIVIWPLEPAFAEGQPLVCFARFSFGTPLPSTIEFALYRCDFPSEQLDPDRSSTVEHDEPTRIIGVDFFDDHEVVMLYKAPGGEGVHLARAGYRELDYGEALNLGGFDSAARHADLWHTALSRLQARNVPPDVLHVAHSHSLVAGASGIQAMALNGREGRRVACVMASSACAVEVFDLASGDIEEDSAEADAPMIG